MTESLLTLEVQSLLLCSALLCSVLLSPSPTILLVPRNIFSCRGSASIALHLEHVTNSEWGLSVALSLPVAGCLTLPSKQQLQCAILSFHPCHSIRL